MGSQSINGRVIDFTSNPELRRRWRRACYKLRIGVRGSRVRRAVGKTNFEEYGGLAKQGKFNEIPFARQVGCRVIGEVIVSDIVYVRQFFQAKYQERDTA